MYHLWVWEGTWRVLASYSTSAEAHRAGKRSADARESWTVTKDGSQKDEHMRANVSDHGAPYS